MARRMDAMHAGTGSDNAPPPLEYGARPPLARRQSTYALLWVAAALVALLIGVFVARVAVRRWEVARVQARCMSHVPPPGATLTPATRTVPGDWARLYNEMSRSTLKSDGTLFLHAMRRPDGLQRLIAIDFLRDELPPRAVVRVIEPGSFRRPPREVAGAAMIAIGTARHFPIYPGRPDPQDPTHFTIDYESFDGRRTLDGWLTNDDAVLLELRAPTDVAATTTPAVITPR
jgi:hypothetical protein